jgi:hypothetical protein
MDVWLVQVVFWRTGQTELTSAMWQFYPVIKVRDSAKPSFVGW